MELFDNLMLGFSVAFTPENLLYALLGCVLGTLIGVLPGIGPVPTIAMLLPITYVLPPVAGLIMLAGIYYGAQYGGSTTAILVALPGETSAVVTVLDGHQMARNGRAGAALAIAALGSFFAGCVATLLLAAFAPPLAEVAFKFGPAEYFSLMCLGLVGAVVLASGSLPKAIAMIILGLLLGMVGTDVNSGVARFDFGVPELQDGIDFAIVAMGVFGFAEIMTNLEQKENRVDITDKIGSLYPNKQEFKESAPAVLRGTALGSALGILPGGGAVLSSFASYTLEKKISKNPERFGKGHPAGLAGPESANNAAAQTSFIPLLTLGIPGNAVMALMVGAMTIHNIQPGPQVMTSHPELFWGLIASMWIGNLMLVVLNLPLIGLWVKLLKVPYRILFPAILVFCTIGVYSLNYNSFDIFTTAMFGVVGYVWSKLKCEGAPLLLGLVLGPMMEENFRRALLLSRGDFSTFVTRPLSASLLAVAVFLVILVALPAIRKKREDFRRRRLRTAPPHCAAVSLPPKPPACRGFFFGRAVAPAPSACRARNQLLQLNTECGCKRRHLR
jgi:putative tricarboxylic transport membrane protein